MRTKDAPRDKETRLYRGRLKTKALVHELALRVNASSPDMFALWFDQKMRDKGLDRRANTAESNRWNVSFKGRAALQAEQLELLQELFTDASDFHQKGPSCLWTALWGEIDSLWPLCKTRIDTDAHYKNESAWEKEFRHNYSNLDLGESLKLFNHEIQILVQVGDDDTPIGYLTEAIALYRIYTHTQKALNPNPNSTEAYKNIFLCLQRTKIGAKLLNLGILDFVTEEIAEMEVSNILSSIDYCNSIGFNRMPSKEEARVYADNPLEWWLNEST
jgi:hypothetical protein